MKWISLIPSALVLFIYLFSLNEASPNRLNLADLPNNAIDLILQPDSDYMDISSLKSLSLVNRQSKYLAKEYLDIKKNLTLLKTCGLKTFYNVTRNGWAIFGNKEPFISMECLKSLNYNLKSIGRIQSLTLSPDSYYNEPEYFVLLEKFLHHKSLEFVEFKNLPRNDPDIIFSILSNSKQVKSLRISTISPLLSIPSEKSKLLRIKSIPSTESIRNFASKTRTQSFHFGYDLFPLILENAKLFKQLKNIKLDNYIGSLTIPFIIEKLKEFPYLKNVYIPKLIGNITSDHNSIVGISCKSDFNFEMIDKEIRSLVLGLERNSVIHGLSNLKGSLETLEIDCHECEEMIQDLLHPLLAKNKILSDFKLWFYDKMIDLTPFELNLLKLSLRIKKYTEPEFEKITSFIKMQPSLEYLYFEANFPSERDFFNWFSNIQQTIIVNLPNLEKTQLNLNIHLKDSSVGSCKRFIHEFIGIMSRLNGRSLLVNGIYIDEILRDVVPVNFLYAGKEVPSHVCTVNQNVAFVHLE